MVTNIHSDDVYSMKYFISEQATKCVRVNQLCVGMQCMASTLGACGTEKGIEEATPLD